MSLSPKDAVLYPASLRDLCSDVDLIICDLWGVMHNGVSPYVAAIDAIKQARASGVQTIFLSNAPRPRGHVRAHLIEMGVPQDIADNVVTSGGLARDHVRSEFEGCKLYHLGPETDFNTIEGLPVTVVQNPDDADVILATDLDFPRVESHRPWLAGAVSRGVPFLCANPDRVVHVGNKLFLCAGSVADLYAAMGGEVRWFGKPTVEAFHACVAEVSLPLETVGERILMIGDSLQTDIAGANAAEYRSLFIASGIHRDKIPGLEKAVVNGGVLQQEFRKIFGAGKPFPYAVSNFLVW
ncbi:MAG: TIGR01459 family HAD-type hydrolase [Kordiimonadales bacterium]|nr:MAG: TIGR01459 family HAD-type hydrolase [Kordiimonadales bacterium]